MPLAFLLVFPHLRGTLNTLKTFPESAMPPGVALLLKHRYTRFVPAAIAIALAEILLYRRYLTGRSKRRATAYGLTANICSALLGWYLMEPIWRFMVSIL